MCLGCRLALFSPSIHQGTIGAVSLSDQTREWYLEHRKVLSDTSADQISRFEKAILTASSAGVAAVFYLAAQDSLPAGVDKRTVVIAAGSFAASFFCILMSHLTSHMDMELEIRKFDKAYGNDDYRGVGSNSWGFFTRALNWLSPLLLAVGGLIFFVMLFEHLK